jgi:hypothetical protein
VRHLKRFFGLSIFFFFPSLPAKAEANPCVQLTQKVCKSFGADSFACQSHQRVARHPNASKERCQERMTSPTWERWEAHLKKQEANMKQLEEMSKQYGSAGTQKVQQFKQKLSDDFLNQMIGLDVPTTQIDPQACEKLRQTVCTDFGAKAFYCQLFTVAIKATGVKIERCQEMHENWPTQKSVYAAQEKILYNLFLQAQKNKALQPKYIRMQQEELLRILSYLRR